MDTTICVNLPIGRSLHHGNYIIEKVLGQGGFGITYLAKDINLNRYVAIKEFYPKQFCNRDRTTSQVTVALNDGEEMFMRLKNKFLHEGQKIAQLNHPNIIRVYAAFAENNVAYYVMDYIQGRSLKGIVEQNGPLPPEQAENYIDKIGSALEYLHAQSMNHLDVKPDNIMIRQSDNEPILIDFGLSKHYSATGQQTTTTPVGISHGYAPIEQYYADGVSEFSPKSDLYSLAATYYYLVTGTVPPPATKIGEEGLKRPQALSQGTFNTIETAMSASRNHRQESVTQFLQQLHQSQTPAASNKNNRTLIVILAALLVVIIALGCFLFKRYMNNKDTGDNTIENAAVVSETVPAAVPETPASPVTQNAQAAAAAPVVNASDDLIPHIVSTADPTFNVWKFGRASINLPKYLTLSNPVNTDTYYFADNQGYVNFTLTIDKSGTRNLETYRSIAANNIGDGYPLLNHNKTDYFAQSGFTRAGEVYYTKTYRDRATNTYYTATVVYPESERYRVDNITSKIFNKFPNLR